MRLNRRNFLEGALAGSALVTLGGPLRQAAFAAEPRAQAPILVFVHMRGACDGLNLLCPANDPSLIAARPAELRVADSGDKAGHSVPSEATPKIDWRLHSAAPELAGLYKAKTLAFVHAAGIPEPNRSHFVANDIMDRGAAGSGALGHAGNGWLARYLGQAKRADGRLPAVSASGSLAGEFTGFSSAFAVGDLANGLPLPFDGKVAALWSCCTAGKLKARPERRGFVRSKPRSSSLRSCPATLAENSCPMPNRRKPTTKPDTGRGLRTVAPSSRRTLAWKWRAWIAAAGTRRRPAGPLPGQRAAALQRARVFWNDISAYHGRVTVVAYSEFGRRLRANNSAGTDHGRGGVMIAMGAGVKGGRILGPWPGLEEAALEERVDLAVKTDYRQVLSELLEYHSGQPLNAAVFPGYKAPPHLGIFA